MRSNQILPLIREKIGAIILCGILIAALSFLFLVISQKNFKTTTDYLVVLDQKNGPQDFFSIAKASEYMGKILGETIYSQLFINEAAKTGKVSSEFLPFDEKERLETWGKMVRFEKKPDVGIISVTVLHNDRNEAVKISDAISEVITKKSYLFRGYGQDADIRIITGPIAEKNPSVGNIILSMLGGFVLGVILSMMAFYYQGLNKTKEVGYNFPEPDEYEESLKYLEK